MEKFEWLWQTFTGGFLNFVNDKKRQSIIYTFIFTFRSVCSLRWINKPPEQKIIFINFQKILKFTMENYVKFSCN